MNECFYYLLAVDCILRRCTISMYLTYLLANEILHRAHEYLPYLPTFPYLTVYSAIVKKEKKRVKKDVVDFAL